MAVKVFIGDESEYEHEWNQFKEVYTLISEKYAKSDEKIYLLFNFRVSNNQIDVSILTEKGIAILDLKSYEGKVIGKENGDWKVITPSGNEELLSTNLFGQLKNQKFALLEKLNKIRIGNFESIEVGKLARIKCWGYFKKGSSYDNEQLGQGVLIWFDVITANNLIEKMRFLNAGYLFRSKEMDAIVKGLSLKEYSVEKNMLLQEDKVDSNDKRELRVLIPPRGTPGNSNISEYIKKYLEKIIDDDKKIWVNNLYTELKAKEIVPVNIRLINRKEHEKNVFDVSELVIKESKLIISGGSGSGKTITLKWLNVIYANRCLKDKESKIPVYIGLNLYNKGTFHDYVKKNVRNNGLSETAFDSLLNDNKIIFLIDGLDLLSSHDQFNPFSEISNFITDHNYCRYVVSSRPGFFGPFESFTVSELEGLNEKIGLFIDKYTQDNRICEPLKNRILNDEKLKSLFSNPLMLYLAIKVASTQKKGDIFPSKRSEMYMQFINGMFEHDFSKKPEGYRLHSNKQQVLETLMDIYFYMQCKNGISMDYCDALEIASKHSEDKRYKPVDAESILDDIFTIGFIPKNNSVITYGIHQSFQEYFSALKLRENFEKDYDISEAFRHPKWEEVVLFASELFICPDDFVRSMINANELHLASKCAQNAGQEIKEEICFLLADSFDKSRYSIEKKAVIESIQRFGDISIVAIVQALHSNDAGVRWDAAWALGKIKSDKSADALFQALNDKDADVRKIAASALGEIKSNKSVDMLIQALHDNDADVRKNAALALGEIKSDKSIDALIQALHDNDAGVGKNAAWALGEIKGDKSIDALIQALHGNDGVRWYAASALGKIKSDKSIDALIQALHDNDADVRLFSAWALGEIKSDKSKDALIQALHDNDADVRKNAELGLGEIKSDTGVDALIQALHGNDAGVGWYAASALGKIKSDKSIDVLIQALHDNDTDVRKNAASALGKIKSDKSIDALIQALHDNDTDVRLFSAWALGELKSDKGVDALIQALHDNDTDVGSYAASALSELSEIFTVRHKELLKKIFLESNNKKVNNIVFELQKKIEINDKSRAELFQKEPLRCAQYFSPPVSTAQQPETGVIDPYFHIVVNEINKILKPTVIVDYGCGYGKLLTPMKNLRADVLSNIRYIGVDAKTACLLKSNWTAEKYGIFKNEPEFMTPEVFFKKEITVNLACLMHTLHEIRLVDLVNSIYHITAKLPVDGQIFILDPGNFIEERNYVIWKGTDFKMIFSNHGFDIRLYPITTTKGNKLNAVNIIKIQNETISKETVADKCFLMYESKKKELYGMLNNNPNGSEKDTKIDLLYSYISRQIDEYKEILNK